MQAVDLLERGVEVSVLSDGNRDGALRVALSPLRVGEKVEKVVGRRRCDCVVVSAPTDPGVRSSGKAIGRPLLK
tara:strand:- start:688 stop:909 length:222 start_codon:yes stop_codon:yes gene_type:complete